MKTISKLDEVERVFLEDLSEDYEGVWTLADRVRGALGIEDPAAVREVSLRLIHERPTGSSPASRRATLRDSSRGPREEKRQP
jgi:hypothetical protein